MRVWLVVLLLPLLGGCSKKHGTSQRAAAIVAKAPGTAECAACSMVVREQPAPRAQVVHRDGARRFLCSLGDLAQYLRAPSKHGKVEAIFVEVLDPKQEPTKTSAATRPWVHAQRAHFVVGVARSGVMGVPVLAYKNEADALRVAKSHRARVVAYERLAGVIQKSR